MAFSNNNPYLTVPPICPGGRRGSAPCPLSGYHEAGAGQYGTLPRNGGSLNPPPATLNPPDPCQNQMNRLSQLLIFLQAKLQMNPFQGNTTQLRHLQHHLQNSVTTIESTIKLRTGLMDLDPPALSSSSSSKPPPSTSTTTLTTSATTKKSDHYRCLFCEPEKKHYGSRGTFKRHVKEKHWPMMEYHCKTPGCLFKAYRKDKALLHNPGALGHIVSRTSPACMTVHPDIPLPPPSACYFCSKAVGTWREWFSCVARHCELPESNPAGSIRDGGGDGDRKDDDDSGDDMDNDNGGFGGGGNGDFLGFQHPNAMGSQSSNGSDIAFSGSQFGNNGGYHCAGESHHSLYNDPMVMDVSDQTHSFSEMIDTIGPSSSIEQNNKDQSADNSFAWSPAEFSAAGGSESPSAHALQTSMAGPSTNSGKQNWFLSNSPMQPRGSTIPQPQISLVPSNEVYATPNNL